MLIIRILFKIIAIPLFLIVGLAELAFKLLINVSSYVIGPLMFFIIGCDIWCLFGQRWLHCLLLTGMAVTCFLVLAAAAVVIVLLETVRGGIGGFIRS
ncbi:MAG: hypothetical protein SPL54_06945 [Lachnospiraceae bacterium]|nr:hypothetical protein [Lachnospiraceae bacterium]